MNLLQKLAGLLLNKRVKPSTRPDDVIWETFPYDLSLDASYLALWSKMFQDRSFAHVILARRDLENDELLNLYRQWCSPCTCEECLFELYGEDPETFGKPLH